MTPRRSFSLKKTSLQTLLVALVSLPICAQAEPDFELSAETAAAGSEMALRVRIRLRPDQYVYAADSAAGWPTAIALKDAAGLEPIGGLTAPNPETKTVEGFGEVTIHHGDVVFTQRYRITGAPGKRKLKGNISYQVCDADSCLLEEKPFELGFEVTGAEAPTEARGAPSPAAAIKKGQGFTVAVKPASGAARVGEPLELLIDFELPEGKYIYAPSTGIEAQRTRISLEDGGAFKLEGALREPAPESKKTEFFGEVLIHKGKLRLRQLVVPRGPAGEGKLAGRIDFQVCDKNTCLMEGLPFAFPLRLLPALPATEPAPEPPAPPPASSDPKFSPKARVWIERGAVTRGEELQLHLAIDGVSEGEYTYAADTPIEGQRPSVSLDDGAAFRLGAITGEAPEDKTVDGERKRVYTAPAVLRLPLKAVGEAGAARLKGRFSFQVCDDQSCKMGEVLFDFPVSIRPRASVRGLGPLQKRIDAVEEGLASLRAEVKRSRGAIVNDVKKALEDLRANLDADKKGGQKYDQILSYHRDDWEGAIKAAKASGKQVFADFTGYFCQNCRMMESTVLVNPRIVKLLRGYERVVLHTDNPKDAEERERHRALLKKLGGAGPIPAYFIVDPETEETVEALNGAASAEKFEAFLKQGSPKQELGWIGFILTCIGLGLLTVVMPCTYPMIPITISVFSKGDKVSRGVAFGRAGIYALGIILSYTAIGGIVQLIFGSTGQQKIQDFANNGVVNLLIGGAFIYFAFSFFGYYEIAMPSFLRNLMQKGAPVQDKSGAVPAWSLFLMGAFFMLTSYSCGAPFVLAVFEQASQQAHPLSVVLALFIFSATLATPFLFLALLPGALKAMPKSGGWFTTFKVTLGFFELAFALKFLSTTDITYNLAFLTRPVFIGVWIIILLLAALYLLGFLRFAHDMKQETVSMGRLIVALILLVMAIYLGSWFSGGKLNSNIEALMPPHPYPELVEAGD